MQYGKSKRDRKLLIEAAEDTKLYIDYAGVESTDSKSYAKSYSIDLKDDIGMVKRLLQYKVVVIPIQENKKCKIGPLGITSFLDCIALGLPIIASDNVCFKKEIVEHNLGIIYKTSDKKELENALLEMMNPDKYKKYKVAVDKYKEGVSVNIYSNKLLKVIESIC